ncbi:MULTISPECIES: hypothetical protein [Paraburkholderia]|uniref:Uncharacterized protein n=1 Tax=Paraburkholderia podalyriae TaxID=1938811 RepID=A0ABR7PVZ1_9BURK|nr:hypothetical protein [Paraburkholderia podalyriae]MBC8750462.1 hypothetical protein [Paraburkholderia podalyriae]
MLNWDDEIQLSRLEVRHARRLAVAPLDEAIAQTDLLLAEVRQLDASPEREQLIERILALRVERLAIKRERLAQLDRMLPQTGRVVPVRAGVLQTTYNRYLEYCEQVICGGRRGQAVSFATRNAFLRPLGASRAPRRTLGLPVARRGLDVVASVLHREAAGRLIFSCGQQVRLPHAHPFHSRSIASRSRMLAPVGAPPGLLSRS